MLPATYIPGFHNEEAVRKMKYSPLGNTGLKVSLLSFGGAALSDLFGNFEEEEAIKAIQEAIRQGVNYIDTAPWYGQGRSETVLGKALKDIPRQAYYIATKVARYEPEWTKMFDFTAEKTKWSIDNSLKLLGLDYVDVIQIHDIDFDPKLSLVLSETLPALEQAVKAGKAHYIGVTGYTLSVLKQAVESSKVSISTILSYSRDTLFDATLQEYIPYFQKQGVGVICAAGLSMGLLTNAGPQVWHPASTELKDTCRAAADYCKEVGVELARLAMHHALTRPGMAFHLVGMNSLKVVHSNLDLAQNGLGELEQKTLDEIKKKFFSKMINQHWEGIEMKNLKAGGIYGHTK